MPKRGTTSLIEGSSVESHDGRRIKSRSGRVVKPKVWQDGSIALANMDDDADAAVSMPRFTAAGKDGRTMELAQHDFSYIPSEEDDLSKAKTRHRSLAWQKSAPRGSRRTTAARAAATSRPATDANPSAVCPSLLLPSSEHDDRRHAPIQRHGGGGLFKQAAIEVLQTERRLMSTGEITRLALKRGLVKCTGKTPEATMASALYTDIKRKKEKSLFVRPSEGLFGLREWTELGVLGGSAEAEADPRWSDNEQVDGLSPKNSLGVLTPDLTDMDERKDGIDDAMAAKASSTDSAHRHTSASKRLPGKPKPEGDRMNRGSDAYTACWRLKSSLSVRTKIREKAAALDSKEGLEEEDGRRQRSPSSSPEAPSTNRLMELLVAAEEMMRSDVSSRDAPDAIATTEGDKRARDGAGIGSGERPSVVPRSIDAANQDPLSSSSIPNHDVSRSSSGNAANPLAPPAGNGGIVPKSLENPRSDDATTSALREMSNRDRHQAKVATSKDGDTRAAVDEKPAPTKTTTIALIKGERAADGSLPQPACEPAMASRAFLSRGSTLDDADNDVKAVDAATNAGRGISVTHDDFLKDSNALWLLDDAEAAISEIEKEYGQLHPLAVCSWIELAQNCLSQSPITSTTQSVLREKIMTALERASKALQRQQRSEFDNEAANSTRSNADIGKATFSKLLSIASVEDRSMTDARGIDDDALLLPRSPLSPTAMNAVATAGATMAMAGVSSGRSARAVHPNGMAGGSVEDLKGRVVHRTREHRHQCLGGCSA